MCDPATATLVITAAATAVSINAQQQQVKYQNQVNDRQAANAMEARAANVNQTNLAMVQEREGAMQKMADNNLTAEAAKSTALTSAGESGISGLSVGSLLDDLAMKQNRFNSSVSENYDRAGVAINNQRENASISAANTIAGLRTPNMPDYAGAALRIAGAGVEYWKAQPSKPKITASYSGLIQAF